ncbi:FAD-binding molybdopterin dehydrogenase [Azorhizobium oxalatiphilum]|uniref:FAD-binding molybdopterin dehydrogenase n=1 Tax=Azorhizobium oxalatiphilum TaxID=980631 RepID=A0A917FFF4_9HYPH|nr:FAD binding domain-containing protein [Azorhizobium oxalatiphilum]GGF76123.1 FAD-binding molybdopterin dehydrogenase [Azorhizobium oxalatiphilum]
MDLNTITALHRPRSRAEIGPWRAGDAFLAGGTVLFAAPDPDRTRLIDLASLDWPALTLTPEGLEIAATCTLAQLEEAPLPAGAQAGDLITACCHALYGAFKVRNAATIGGNLCTALPAAPMAALVVALDATLTLWPAEGGERQVAAADFILGPQQTVLAPGEMLRSIFLSTEALGRRWALRRMALNDLGRNAALLVGTLVEDGFALTITAATPRPVHLAFTGMPDAAALDAVLEEAIPPDGYYDDVHGDPAWRRHLTRLFAQQIRSELLGESAP